jgi:LIVCS family branched-chain amino acid:cation transporter
LACLTTCVGLINSISQYFSILFKKINYRQWVFIIVAFSFLICNLGLTAILSISIPILNAIYPISIVLIILGLSHPLWEKNRYVYPVTISATGFVSVIYALDTTGIPLGSFGNLFRQLPLYSMGFCWVSVAVAALAISFAINFIFKGKQS